MESASFTGSNSRKSPSFDLESSYISISSVDDLWRNSTTETDVFSNDQFNSYEDSFAGFSTLSSLSFENDLSSSSGRSESDGDAESIGEFNRLDSSDSNSGDRLQSNGRLITPASGTNSLALAPGATVIVAPAGHSFTLSQNDDQTTTINCTSGTNGSVRSVVFLPSTPTTLSLGQSQLASQMDLPTQARSVLDENSILEEMALNKEALRMKLMLRRPLKQQMVDQGLMSSLKVPSGFYEQTARLERPKTGDLLKHKIQHRPDREKLIAQHILLESSGETKQQPLQLKKCRLADSLNEKLAIRPGQLELVQSSSLHVDDSLEPCAKDGSLKTTANGVKQPGSQFSFSEGDLEGIGLNFDVDVSQLPSLGSSMPGLTLSSSGGFALSRTDSGDSQSPNLPSFLLQNSREATPPALLNEFGNGARANVVASGKMTIVKSQRQKKKLANKSYMPSNSPLGLNVGSPGSVGVSSGNGPKGRIIKFHEYKGPAVKSGESMLKDTDGTTSGSSGSSLCGSQTGEGQNGFSSLASGGEMSRDTAANESSYDLMLQQQQLLLQWQLELQKKYPNANIQLMPVPASRNPDGTVTVSAASVITPKEVGDSGGSVTITNGLSDANFNSLYNGTDSTYSSEMNQSSVNSGAWLNGSPSNFGRENSASSYGGTSVFQESLAGSPDCSDVSTPSPQSSNRASMSLSSPGTTAICFQFSQSNLNTAGIDHGVVNLPTMSFVDPPPIDTCNSQPPMAMGNGQVKEELLTSDQSCESESKSAGKPKKCGSAGQRKKLSSTDQLSNTTEGSKSPKKLFNGVVKSTLKAKKSDCSAVSEETKIVITKLDDMKVSDLKAECKKRNLPVSGPKPNLLERLKPYEEGIMVGIRAKQQAELLAVEESEANGEQQQMGTFQSQPAKLPPIQNVTSFLGLKGATGGFPMDSCDVGGGQTLPTSFLPPYNRDDSAADRNSLLRDSTPGCNSAYLQAQISSPTVSSSGTQPEYSGSGSVARAMAFNTPRSSSDFSLLSFNGANGSDQSSIGFLPPHGNADSVADGYQLVDTSEEGRNSGFRQQCFTYTSQNSGGQFIVNSTTASEGMDSCHSAATPSSHILPDTKSNDSGRTFPVAPMEVDSTVETQRQSHSTEYESTADQRPDIDENELFQSKNNSLATTSASALCLHEEVLRQQQKRIEELQRELQKSQDQLRRQQQIIIAAKKAQTEKNAASADGLSSEYDTILAQLDTKQLQKFHIQLFLQHKLQQQQLQQQMTTQQELQLQQAKLKEEFAVHQAVQEVVHLLRREPRAAQTIVRLLKNHQSRGQRLSEDDRLTTNEAENGDSNSHTPNTTTSSSSSSTSPLSTGQPASVRTKSRQASGARSTDSKKPHNNNSLSVPKGNSMPTSPSKTAKVITPLDADHMEEIFKSVLSYAEKLTSSGQTENDNSAEEHSDNQQLQGVIECHEGSELVEEPSEEFNYSAEGGVEMSDHMMFANPESRMFASRYDFVHPPSNYTGQMEYYSSNNQVIVDPVAPDCLTLYTKNEALDDLLEILRNNEADDCSGQFLQSFPNTFAGEPNDVSNLSQSGWYGMNGSMTLNPQLQPISVDPGLKLTYSGNDISPQCEQMEWLERMMQSPGSFHPTMVESHESGQFPEISSSSQPICAEMFTSKRVSSGSMRKSCNPLLAEQGMKPRKSDATGATVVKVESSKQLSIDSFELFNFVDQTDAELDLRLT